MADELVVNADNTKIFGDAFDLAIVVALEKIGLLAEGYAQKKCPVDTGNLRGSITHEVDTAEKSVAIGTNVEYAPYVELGTWRQEAQPFLKPAAEDHKAQYVKILRGELHNG